MGQRVQQGGPQLLAAAGGLYLVRQVLGPGALQADGHQVGDALQHGIRHADSLNAQRRDGLRSEPDRGDHAPLLRIGERTAMARGVAQLIVHPVELGRPGAVDLVRPPVVQHYRVHRKNLRQPSRELLWERLALLDEQDRAAEGIQAFHVLPARDGVLRPPFGLRRQPAGDQRCRQKTEQRHPVLRVIDGQLADGRKKEQVQQQRGRHGGQAGFGEAPRAGDDQYQQQVGETRRGGVDLEHPVGRECYQRHAGDRYE